MRKNEKGQGLIESAFVLIVFLFVLLGILDFGQFLYFHQSLTERVRAAARYGAVHTYTDGVASVNVALYNDPAGSVNGGTPLLPNVNGPGQTDSGKATIATAITDAGSEDARIRVTISNFPMKYLILPSSLTQRTVSYSQPYEIGR
jgi:Flp pilus assembly protein TadG